METTDKYIAFLDILGYRDLITANRTDEIIGLFENIPVYVQRSLANGKTRMLEDRLQFDVTNGTINSIIISDTLIFWTNNTSTEGFFELLNCIQHFMNFMFNLPAVFLRGCITVGEFNHKATGYIRTREGAVISHPMIFGKGLVAAHLLEKGLNFAGCLLDEQAIQTAELDNPLLFNVQWAEATTSNKVIRYPVPFKNTDPKEHWAVNWVSLASNPTRSDLEESFARYHRNVGPPDVQTKIQNTLYFYDYVKSKSS